MKELRFAVDITKHESKWKTKSRVGGCFAGLQVLALWHTSFVAYLIFLIVWTFKYLWRLFVSCDYIHYLGVENKSNYLGP